MPTKREREYYRMGFDDGMDRMEEDMRQDAIEEENAKKFLRSNVRSTGARSPRRTTTPKRKLSAWQKYIKNKRNHIKFRDGKLNLKKMGVAFRRKKRR